MRDAILFRATTSEQVQIADKEVVLVAVQNYGDALQNASVELKADKEVVLVAVRQNGDALRYASAELKADKEVVLAAVRQNGDTLKYASVELTADKEVVLTAVQDNGYAIYYASKKLRDDKEVVLTAVQFGDNVLQYVSPNFEVDSGFVLDVCRTLAGKRIQKYPTVHSWIRQLPSLQGELALTLFMDTTVGLDKLIERETDRHMLMVDTLTALSKGMTDQAMLEKIDSFLRCLSAPESLIAKRDCKEFESDF
jgi:hypothetical protein